MSNQSITSPDAPKAVGPYSAAVLAGNTLFISGQLGLDPKTGKLQNGVEAQAEQGLKNLGALLKAAGMGYENVVKTTIFIQDMNDFAKINAIYGNYFKDFLPARSCVEIGKLPMNGLFEVEAVAVKG